MFFGWIKVNIVFGLRRGVEKVQKCKVSQTWDQDCSQLLLVKTSKLPSVMFFLYLDDWSYFAIYHSPIARLIGFSCTSYHYVGLPLQLAIIPNSYTPSVKMQCESTASCIRIKHNKTIMVKAWTSLNPQFWIILAISVLYLELPNDLYVIKKDQSQSNFTHTVINSFSGKSFFNSFLILKIHSFSPTGHSWNNKDH